MGVHCCYLRMFKPRAFSLLNSAPWWRWKHPFTEEQSAVKDAFREANQFMTKKQFISFYEDLLPKYGFDPDSCEWDDFLGDVMMFYQEEMRLKDDGYEIDFINDNIDYVK